MRELPPGCREAEKKNPAQSVDRAVRAFEAFTGDEPGYLESYTLDDGDGAGWALGFVPEIHYIARRDGETAEYVHRFKRESRPLLVVSDDGSRLYLLGGAFSVTDRGIVDH